MDFKFGVVADYAGAGHRSKLILVGIFDTVWNPTRQWPLALPLSYLVGAFEAHPTEGSSHGVALRFRDEDGQEAAPHLEAEIRLVPQGPGRPLKGQLIVPLVGLTVPHAGVYEFHFLEAGRHLGGVPIFVRDGPPAE